jgi:DNA-directed RNA polymerase subunit RPC12/RpoP
MTDLEAPGAAEAAALQYNDDHGFDTAKEDAPDAAATLVRNDVGKWACSVCGKTFSHRGIANRHLMTHGEGKFACATCERRFTERITLKRHERTHTGEKPYNCETCGEAFTVIATLNDHKRTHSGARPYTCAVCARTFTTQSSSARHAKTHAARPGWKLCQRGCAKWFATTETCRKHEEDCAGYTYETAQLTLPTAMLARSQTVGNVTVVKQTLN